jgi:hypothetical protein
MALFVHRNVNVGDFVCDKLHRSLVKLQTILVLRFRVDFVKNAVSVKFELAFVTVDVPLSNASPELDGYRVDIGVLLHDQRIAYHLLVLSESRPYENPLVRVNYECGLSDDLSLPQHLDPSVAFALSHESLWRPMSPDPEILNCNWSVVLYD